MSRIIVILFSSFFLLSCLNRYIDSDSELNICKQEVMKYSDLEAYLKLTNYFVDDSNYYELLPYSIKMIQDSKIGYSDFYDTYMRIRFNNKYEINNFFKLNMEEKRLLKKILLEGSKEGDFRCDEVLKELHRLGTIDTSSSSPNSSSF